MGVVALRNVEPGEGSTGRGDGTLGRGMSSRLSLLVDLSSLLGREVDLDALLTTACERIAAALHADRATIWLLDSERGDLVTRVAMLPEVPELRQPLERGIAGYVMRMGDVVRLEDASRDPRFDPTADRVTGYATRSMLVVPMRERAETPSRGVIQVLNKKEGPFDEEDEKYLVALATQLARALALTTLRAADAAEPGVVLRGPLNRIVGRSEALREVYERVLLAAQTDATVLLRGETGTGKGRFARAVHVNSKRQNGPFVTVDCTTLPAQLVESELFGHERGAFTGADRRVVGKVDLAAGGTLFLDEIGDLPLDIQGKLLRFLQEHTYERVGGRETLHTDVRVVCATHRDLRALVEKGTFREDLFYRVRVVEIVLPPLRVRGAAEVMALAEHFADMYAKRYGRPAPTFAKDAQSRLLAHDFPGNVRELEHWIESAIVLASDGVIRGVSFPAGEGSPRAAGPSSEPAIQLAIGLSLEEAERRYAKACVDQHDGNKTEAARALGIGRNTLARLLKE
jgi:transcriptional regulator with GAF, ATPase, and Fis domain